MQEKPIQLRAGVWINIPEGLTPEQESQFLADLDSAALAVECKEILRLHEQGHMIPFEVVLADLLKDPPNNGQPT
jgi:hypothetical protein